MADTRRVYIDACCFVDMVKTKVGKNIAQERELDVWFLKRLLEAARDREIEVYTSVISIAECTHVGDDKIAENVKNEFSRLLMSGQYARLIMLTPFVAEDARDLRWKNGIALKGADGIHVASALATKCEEMLSSNGRLARLGAETGKLQKLGLAVRRGKDTVCLPEKYRQLALDDEQKRH